MKKKRLLLTLICAIGVWMFTVGLFCVPKHNEECKEAFCYDISTKNSRNQIVEASKFLRANCFSMEKFCEKLGIEKERLLIKQSSCNEYEYYCVLSAKGFELVYIFFIEHEDGSLFCSMTCSYPSLGVWDNGVLDLLHEEDYPREIMKRIHR